MTNAERQARWRAKRNALAAQAAKGGASSAADKARIRELEAELARERKLRAAAEAKRVQAKPQKKADMPRATFNAVVRCLHPESRKHMSAAQFDEACGLFTQWKKARDKA